MKNNKEIISKTELEKLNFKEWMNIMLWMQIIQTAVLIGGIIWISH